MDGDTIHIRVGGRVEKVRYIGVNTPEVHHPTKGEQLGGQDAAAVNRALVAPSGAEPAEDDPDDPAEPFTAERGVEGA